MYMKSENSQALQSQQMITDALLILMKAYPYKDITITQICQEAQVVRQTFYRNFEFKIDVLEFYLDNMFQKYTLDHFDSEVDAYQQLKSFFDYMIPYKDFLLLIEKNDLLFLLNKTISIAINTAKFSDGQKIMETIQNPKLVTYVIGFIASSICSILSLWIKNNFEESSEILANLAKTFFKGLEETVN